MRLERFPTVDSHTPGGNQSNFHGTPNIPIRWKRGVCVSRINKNTKYNIKIFIFRYIS